MDDHKLLCSYFFNNPFVGITVTDGEGNCIMVNEAHTRITGIQRNKMVGRNLRNLMDENIFSVSSTLEVLETGKEVNLHQKVYSGSSYEVKGIPVIGEDGRIKYVINYLIDANMTEDFRRLVMENETNRKLAHDPIPHIQPMIKVRNGIVYNCKKMDDLIELATKVASSDATVLITGESGTGKELFANLVHENSNRNEQPFIKINCAAIPENLLESELFGYEPGSFTGGKREGSRGIFVAADKGSLFLDEVSELSLSLQAKLLRVLQEKEVMRLGSDKPVKIDVRIIAATNASLLNLMKQKRFREDLYYRLNVINLHIPPLADHKEDIPVLIVHFINEFNQSYSCKKRISKEALDFLSSRKYPGNVRELQNIIERLVLQSESDVIGINDAFELYGDIHITGSKIAPLEISNMGSKSLKELMDDYEKQILKGFTKVYKKPEEVARRLRIDRSTLSRKYRKHNFK